MQEKEIWNKPKMIILAKVKPEEAVLASCKASRGTPILVPGQRNNACRNPSVCGFNCNVQANS